jgi:hypothetical protein
VTTDLPKTDDDDDDDDDHDHHHHHHHHDLLVNALRVRFGSEPG